MQLVECKACGSKELVDEGGVIVCAYCQTKYPPEVGSPVAAPPSVVEAPKTQFDVVLHSAGRDKIGAIKTVIKLTGLGLKEAKDLAESAPPLSWRMSGRMWLKQPKCGSRSPVALSPLDSAGNAMLKKWERLCR